MAIDDSGLMSLDTRLEIEELARTDEDFQRECLERLRDDPDRDVFFANAFCWTYDPRIDKETGEPIGPLPMLLWPAQVKYVRFVASCIDNGQDGLVEKSRDVGATWCTLIPIYLRWLLVDSFLALIGTYVDELIDIPEEPDCLFWKLDFLLRWTPPFLQPDGFNSDICRTVKKLYNPQTGSTISGRAPTKKFSRSGRKTCILMDEWAFWQYGREAAKAAAGTSPCRLFVSTPNGDDANNHFDELANSRGDFRDTYVRKFRLHWTDDPRKNMKLTDPLTGREYYPFKRQMLGDPANGIPGRMTEQEFAQEYDIDFEKSLTSNIYTEQLKLARIGDFPYDPTLPVFCSIDFGISDTCILLFLQFDYRRFRFRFIDYYAKRGHGIDFYAPLIRGSEPGEVLPGEQFYGKEERDHIERRNSWKRSVREVDGHMAYRVDYEGIYGDPSGRSRGHSDGRSAKQVLDEDFDILVQDKTRDGAMYFNTRIRESRYMLMHSDFDEQRCRAVFDMLRQYKINPDTGKPEHEESSHYASATQYFSVNCPYIEALRERGAALSPKVQTPPFNGSLFGPNFAGMSMEQMMSYLHEEDTHDKPRRGRNYGKHGRTGYGF